MQKAKDLRKDTVKELESKLGDIRKKHMELRFQHASGTLNNPLELRTIKRDIARIQVVINEKKNESE
ncbi:MAG: 50S ribosomal protein L29 [Elusimicrobiota bacterium]